jgi:hypothetical protein
MSENQQSWMEWARTLQHWGIKDAMASLLEITGSLGVILAQVVYLIQPMLSGALSSSSLLAFARVLEEPDSRREFITFLRETPTSGTSA